MFKSFIFDGTRSEELGIYITGQGVYNAPERDVEMIEIPGRNGAIALDNGRFKNIEVTFPAGAYGKDQTEFAEKMSDLRNYLLSKRGYKRLEDEYNPNEFRLGLYKKGLEVAPVQRGEAGEFDIVFDCKPQRYLKSGQTGVEVASGDVLTNPTYFDSKPLIKTWGNGTLNLGGKSIEVNGNANLPLGELTLMDNQIVRGESAKLYALTNAFNSGDSMKWSGAVYRVELIIRGGTLKDNSAEIVEPMDLNKIYSMAISSLNGVVSVAMWFADLTVTGQEPGGQGIDASQDITFVVNVGGVEKTARLTLTPSIFRAAFNEYFEMLPGNPSWVTQPEGVSLVQNNRTWETGTAVVDSTVTTAGNPAYIDLETGEAYKMNGSNMVSLNKYISLPTDFPTLKAGNNTITFDNTFSKVEIVPRWWKI